MLFSLLSFSKNAKLNLLPQITLVSPELAIISGFADSIIFLSSLTHSSCCLPFSLGTFSDCTLDVFLPTVCQWYSHHLPGMVFSLALQRNTQFYACREQNKAYQYNYTGVTIQKATKRGINWYTVIKKGGESGTLFRQSQILVEYVQPIFWHVPSISLVLVVLEFMFFRSF